VMEGVPSEQLVSSGHVSRVSNKCSTRRLAAPSPILIDLPLIWMPQKRSRSPVRTHMPFLQP